MSYSLFRCIAALSRDHNVSNTGANIAINWLMVFSGFALSQSTTTVKNSLYYETAIVYNFGVLKFTVLYFR